MRGVLHSPTRSPGFRGRHPPSGAQRALIHRHAAIHRALHSPRSSISGRPTHPRCCHPWLPTTPTQAPLPDPQVIPQAPLPAPLPFSSSWPPDSTPAPSRGASPVFCRRSICVGNRRRWIDVGPFHCGDRTPCSVTGRPHTCGAGRPNRPPSTPRSPAQRGCGRRHGFGCTVAHSIPYWSTNSRPCRAPRPHRRCSIASQYFPEPRPSC